MVFYFTGTGNSLYAAKELDAEIISIPQAIKQERLEFAVDSIGIVCPVYGHEMPGMVKEFIQRSSFDTGYLFVVLTYGAHHGGAAEIAGLFFQSVGKKADYITSIEMVDNFLPAMEYFIACEYSSRLCGKGMRAAFWAVFSGEHDI